MVSNDAQDELAEGFEPTALPPIAADGGLELPPMREAPRAPPRLCEAGPCKSYHRMVMQLDAAKPLPVRGADGAFEQPKAADHIEIHHYCYPDVGIETKLGGLPVIQCNRWSPITAQERADVENVIGEFTSSEAGQAYVAELEAWKADQERIASELAEAIDTASDDLGAMPIAMCPLRYVFVPEPPAQGEHPGMPFSVPWDATLARARELALTEIGYLPGYAAADPNPWDIAVAVSPPAIVKTRPLDPTLTVSAAGLSAGDLLVFSRTTKEPTP